MPVKNFLEKKGLWLIIILFFIIGLTGIFYNYGVNTVGDELPLTSTVLKMISDHTLAPNYSTFYHVPLAVYFYLPFFILFLLFLRLSGVFTSLEAIQEFGIIDFNKFLPLARFLTVLMGIFSIYLLYKICEKLFNNKSISILASFLLSSSLMFVQLSHFARVWLPQLMVVLIAFYFIAVLYQKEEIKIKNYILVGLTVGLALGTHVIGVLVYFSFLASHYFKNSGKKFKDIFIANKYFWLVNLIIVFFYFLILFLNPRGFYNYINRDGGILPNFNFLFESVETANGAANNGLLLNVISSFKNFGYYAKTLIEFEPMLILLFIIGAAFLFLKERKKFYIIISFILAYYVGVSFAGLIPYYILPIIPFLCLIAGYGIYNLYVKINKPAALAIIVLILILNFIPSLMWIYRLAQPSTTMMAREWIYDNIPSGSKIINFDIPLELNENKQAINDIKNFSSQFNKKRVYLSLMEEINYPKPNYYILYCSYYDVIPEELMKKKYDYLIVSFWNKIDFEEKQARLNDLKFKQKAALYKKFPEGADENNFSMNLANITNPIYNLLFKIRQSGPTIYIYKMD